MTQAPRALVLDVQGLQSPLHRERGIARFIQGHAAALGRSGRVAMFGLNPSWPMAADLPAELLDSPALRWNTARELAAVEADRIAYLLMSPFELGARADAIQPPALQHRDSLRVVTLYDLIPLIMRATYLTDPNTRRRYETRLRVVESADLVLAISEQSRHDAIERLALREDRVVNIGAGLSPFFRMARADEHPDQLVRAALPQITRSFVLCVSGEDNNRKNIDGLIRAYARLRRDMRDAHQLVVTCKLSPQGRALWQATADLAGLAPSDVVFTGGVTDEVLRALYQTATASVSPSLYEGFGLPAVEAAACGCPSVGARTSALGELSDDAGALFDPTSTDEMTAVMDRALADEAWRDQLAHAQQRASGRFNWDAVAARTLDAIDRSAPPAAPRSRPRLRMAIVSPLPPVMSGVADYTARVVASLSKIADVDAYYTPSGHAPSAPLGAARARPADALERFATPGMYDGLIYVVGNSAAHHEVVEIARRVPGIVWFHDVRLAGLYLSMPSGRFDPGWRRARGVMEDRLIRQYGARLSQEVMDRWNDPTVYDRHGLGLTGELVARAPLVLVNSEHAARLVRLDQAPTARPLTIDVLPFAARDPSVLASRNDTSSEVVVPGWMDWIKQPDVAIDAIARVRQTSPNVTLTFVGNMSPDLQRDLCDLARDLAVPTRFLGYVDEATYWQSIGRAGCAIALRKASRGESSAAASDCLAAGVPVVTNSATAAGGPALHVVPVDATPGQVAEAVLAALAARPNEAIALPTFDDLAESLLEAVNRTHRDL
ncbi:MAG: glycosyltransferase [Actinobacteria bacterium]|nr:glycosyltransferase [Actinomycetota bacterium]